MQTETLVRWFGEIDLTDIPLVGGKRFEPAASSTIR